MSQALRHRLAKLEAQAPEWRQVILLADDWRRLSPAERAELGRDPRLQVMVIDTGIERGEPGC